MDIDNERITVTNNNKKKPPKQKNKPPASEKDLNNKNLNSDFGRDNIELDSELSTNRRAPDSDKVFSKLVTQKKSRQNENYKS